MYIWHLEPWTSSIQKKKIAGKCSICWEYCKGPVKKQFVIMGIEAWYWFHKGKQKQKCHGEFDHTMGISGIDVLCTIPVLMNQKQNKTLMRKPHWFHSTYSEITLSLHHVSKLGSIFWGMGVVKRWFAIYCNWSPWLIWENLKNQLLSVCPGSC
jgi:hypothetical protein